MAKVSATNRQFEVWLDEQAAKGEAMPDTTTRDRELAQDLIHKFQPEHDAMEPWEVVEYLEERFAQARREGWEEGIREAQVGLLADHDCEPVVDLSHCFGEGRECRLGRLTRAPEGWEHETWCLHLRSPLKGEVIFLLNEGDFCAGAALAYAALGYHVNPEWVESVAAGKGWDHYEVGCYPKPDEPAPPGAEE